VSRPVEVEEEKPAEEKTVAPRVPVERAPKRGKAPAEPPPPVAAPPPVAGKENAKEKTSLAGEGHASFRLRSALRAMRCRWGGCADRHYIEQYFGS